MIDKINSILKCNFCESAFELVSKLDDKKPLADTYIQCISCKKKHSIIDDVLFLENKTQKNSVKYQSDVYSYWWKSSHKNIMYDDEKNKKIFSSTISFNLEKINNLVVLDAGCGNGRFSKIISNYNPSLFIIADISDGIFEAKKYLKDRNINYLAIKGDISEIPFKDEVVDFVYSWGVIHHTEDPQKTFKNICRVVKKNGTLGIYVYKNNPDYKYNNLILRFFYILRQILIILPLRYICKFLSKKNVKRLFVPIFYFEKFINYGIVGCHRNSGDKFNKEDYFRVVIDRFKTGYASEHQELEVATWFYNHGFNDLVFGTFPKIGVTATKFINQIKKIKININVE